MSRLLSLSLIAVAALSGCSLYGASSVGLAFETAAAEYAPGDAVDTAVRNESEEPVYFNICFAFLDLVRGGEVVAGSLGPDQNAACQSDLRSLAPGEVAEGTARLPDGLEPGTYRLATEVEVDGDRRRLVTRSFEVR